MHVITVLQVPVFQKAQHSKHMNDCRDNSQSPGNLSVDGRWLSTAVECLFSEMTLGQQQQRVGRFRLFHFKRFVVSAQHSRVRLQATNWQATMAQQGPVIIVTIIVWLVQ